MHVLSMKVVRLLSGHRREAALTARVGEHKLTRWSFSVVLRPSLVWFTESQNQTFTGIFDIVYHRTPNTSVPGFETGRLRFNVDIRT